MFNGWPATYADIASGLTFDRTMAEQANEFLHLPARIFAAILGPSGVGKSTAARQAMIRLYGEGFCWEHRGEHILLSKEWRAVAHYLVSLGKQGALFIDDAHEHLHELNDLIDSLVTDKLTSLRVLAALSRNNWRPRVKSPNLFKVGKEFHLSQLDLAEIDRLLALVNTKEAISHLVESSFSGFSQHEKRRRLIERAEADMFVCMKNIFASETFDHIVLREFAELRDTNQEIYRIVAALESAGVHVHRQLVIRLLSIPATSISAILEALTDIVTEYTVSEKDHIYGWSGRHPVINQIITRYKFSDTGKTVDLFDKVIDNINPTYDLEIRSIRELCNVEYGITRIADKRIQNRLLRKMISTAPGERVPRHRLIRNLIDMGDFDPAETEIRVFEKDFRKDGPVARYKINLIIARAVRTPGIMQEDRVVMLEHAIEEARVAIQQYPFTYQVFAAYCQVGWELFRLTGKPATFDDAMAQLKEAESRIGDPQITNTIRNFERRMTSQFNSDGA